MPTALALVSLLLLSSAACNEYGFIAARRTGDLSAGEPARVRFDERGRSVCGDGDVTDAGRRALRRYPYLQQVGATDARILWTTQQPWPARAVVSKGAQLVADVPSEVDTSAPLPVGRQFEAHIKGLEPDTLYCYEIVGADGAWIESTSFITAPKGDAPVSFAVLGDVGKRSPDQFAVRDQLETVAMDFVLITGDVGYDDGKLAEYERNVFSVYRDLMRRVPFFPASGNHDYNTDDATPFRQVFSLPANGGKGGRERWYSFDWGPVHVTVLDTEVFGQDQIQWTERDLKASRAPWKVVVLHRPPFSSGTHGNDLAVQELFVPLFYRHGVDVVFSGHDHHYERSRPVDGVVYMVTGGGGRGTRRIRKNLTVAFAERVAHFVYAVVQDGVMTLYALDGEGKVFDTLRLDPRAGAALETAER